MRLPASLQGRLLALVLGMVAAVWMVAVTATWIDVRHELDELLDSHLAQAAALLVVQQAGEFDDDQAMDAPQLHRYATKVSFQVFHEGQLTLRSANAPAQPMVYTGQRFAGGFHTVRMDGASWRVFAAQGAKRDVQVYVGEQEVPHRHPVGGDAQHAVAGGGGLAAAGIGCGLGRGVRGTAPLRELGRMLAGRQPQTLSPVVVANAPSEMGPMLDALNGLLGRISELMASERRFTADAAHELRTPIAAIRAQAQVAMAESNGALREHALQSTLDGC